MIDYEKIAESVEIPIESAPNDGIPEALAANRKYLPVNHPKYAGIAEAKGYAQGDDFSGNRLQRTKYSHEAMIEVILTEPTISQGELAKRFERTQGWISIVINSDAFQAALAKRRDDIIDPFLVATIEERIRGLAYQSLEILSRKLAEPLASSDLALKGLDIATKALGFGARNPAQTSVQNNFVVQLPPKIDSPSEWARTHSSQPILNG